MLLDALGLSGDSLGLLISENFVKEVLASKPLRLLWHLNVLLREIREEAVQ